MNTISFMTANFVARQLDYQMTGGWGEGDKATNNYFQPLATFGQRFEAMLQEVQAMGFSAIDLWLAHLNYNWATTEHIAIAQNLLAKYELEVVSLAGWFGANLAEFEEVCQLAAALNCQILGGSTAVLKQDRAAAAEKLAEYDLKLGLENHPEKNPGELLAKIGDGGNGRIEACVDTGWFATQGYDPAQALVELKDHLVHVHLKDVLAPNEPNEHYTCAYGQGIVPIEQCVRTLQELGYQGGISIEHEPEQYDPTADCIAGFKLVRGWLNS